MLNTVLPVQASTGGAFGGSGDGLWLFAILALTGGFGGGLGNRGAGSENLGYQIGQISGSMATKDSVYAVQNSTNQGFAGLNTAITTATNQIGNGISASTFEIVNQITAFSKEFASCCCNIIKQLSDGFGAVLLGQEKLGNQIFRDNCDNTKEILAAITGLSKQMSDTENQRLRDENMALKFGRCGCNSY